MKPKKKQKKKTRRSEQKNPDLDPRFNLKTRTELLDQDYLNKLSQKELNWLNKFNKEEINASFDSEKPKRNLNKSKASRKKCYDRNNARNRDILTRAKASNNLVDIEELVDDTYFMDYEDRLLDEMEKQETREAIEWLAECTEKDEDSVEKTLIMNLKQNAEKVKP